MEEVVNNGKFFKGIEIKLEIERFTVVGSCCRRNVFFFSRCVLQNSSRNFTKMRAARAVRATRLFLIFRPIVSLHFGVSVAIALILTWTPQFRSPSVQWRQGRESLNLGQRNCSPCLEIRKYTCNLFSFSWLRFLFIRFFFLFKA